LPLLLLVACPQLTDSEVVPFFAVVDDQYAVMQAGFAMLEVGSVGAKHTKNLLIKVGK